MTDTHKLWKVADPAGYCCYVAAGTAAEAFEHANVPGADSATDVTATTTPDPTLLHGPAGRVQLVVTGGTTSVRYWRFCRDATEPAVQMTGSEVDVAATIT